MEFVYQIVISVIVGIIQERDRITCAVESCTDVETAAKGRFVVNITILNTFREVRLYCSKS
jgi:hypothetical protein